LLFFRHFPGNAQTDDATEKLNLPGDNLNLAAVLDVFQRSPTLEDFEAVLNADTSKINNLDLNNDNQIDYIKVLDKQEGTLHSIILQVDINETESQDVAVIFVEKKGEDVQIQLVGDEDLYGKDYILEPASDQRSRTTENPGYTGDGTTINTTNNYYYNTENYGYASRPELLSSSLFMGNNWVYLRTRVCAPWNSPWHWGYYPGYGGGHGAPIIGMTIMVTGIIIIIGMAGGIGAPLIIILIVTTQDTGQTEGIQGVVMNYKSQGVYRKTYENPNPSTTT
jgi:hypothetical protein